MKACKDPSFLQQFHHFSFQRILNLSLPSFVLLYNIFYLKFVILKLNSFCVQLRQTSWRVSRIMRIFLCWLNKLRCSAASAGFCKCIFDMIRSSDPATRQQRIPIFRIYTSVVRRCPFQRLGLRSCACRLVWKFKFNYFGMRRILDENLIAINLKMRALWDISCLRRTKILSKLKSNLKLSGQVHQVKI